MSATSGSYLKSPESIAAQEWAATVLPIVSILCEAYNQEKYIRDALGGFLTQKTTFRVEVLVHDDASADATASIIKEYEQKYPRLIFPIFQSNNKRSKGVQPRVRYQLPRARGKYIALCEGDDYWTDPLKLQKQVDFLERNQEYAMCSHAVEVISEGVEEGGNSYEEGIADATFEQILERKLFIALNSIVYRRELLPCMPEWINKLNGGHTALIYLLTSKGKNRHFFEKMGVRRRNPGGITSAKWWKERDVVKNKICLLEHLKVYCNGEKDIPINKKIEELYGEHIKVGLKKGNLVRAVMYLGAYCRMRSDLLMRKIKYFFSR